MNAYSTTLRGIASALTSRPRVEQTVHLSATLYRSPDAPRHIVLVIPHGQDKGEYYEVSDTGYRLLQDGASPEYLELEPVDYDTFEGD